MNLGTRNAPRIVGRHTPTTPPMVTTRPHTLHLTGQGPQFDLTFDSGADEPVHVVELTRDLCYILKAALQKKLDQSL